jgi:hypothetical protein
VLGSLTSLYSQLSIGAGPAFFIDENQNSSIDYTVSVDWNIHRFDIGFEWLRNGYKEVGRGAAAYGLYQYNLFGRYYPFRKKTWFLKAGANIASEYYHLEVKSGDGLQTVDENGTLFGLEGGLGFQDKLIKNTGLFFNVAVTYNHLFLLRDDYFFDYHKNPVPFYALKLSLIYQFDFYNVQ